MPDATIGFADRHIGPRAADLDRMLDVVGAPSLDALMDQAIPAGIRLTEPLDLPDAESEAAFLARMRTVAAGNARWRSFIGLGYYGCVTPPVILRNLLENPGWYTPYTPYQAEVAQGRLEALLNFQTAVADLTGMEIANASLLDEATAAAEAMTMLYRLQSRQRPEARRFLVSSDCFPQTIEVVRGRAEPLDIHVEVADVGALARGGGDRPDDLFGVLAQSPDACGRLHDLAPVTAWAHAAGALVAVASDLLALTLATPPGEMDADVVVGNAQRFGVPLGYGGPHAAFFAARRAYVRQVPGRMIGVSVDAQGRPAYRMALQTREQHIRRERATSNICTAQALLANVAGMYAAYHGPAGLRGIARRVHGLARLLAGRLESLGVAQRNDAFFDTLRIVPGDGGLDAAARAAAEAARINFRYHPDGDIGIALDETSTREDVEAIAGVFARAAGAAPARAREAPLPAPAWPDALRRDVVVPHPPGIQPPSLRTRDDAVPQAARAQGHRSRHVDDPPGLVHDEAQRRGGDGAGHLARVRQCPSLRAPLAGGRLPGDHRGARGIPLRHHRLRRRVAATQLGRPGGVRRAAGHSGVPPRPRGA